MMHRLGILGTSILFSAGLFSTGLRAQEPNAAATLALADPLVRPLIDGRLTIGLTLGVLRNNETAIRGYGHVTKGETAQPDGKTVYEIGSISKVFTGILLADAAQRGLVKFDDPVASFVPKGTTVPQYEGQVMTLTHLTTHRSALPRLPPNFTSGLKADPYADYDREQLYAGLTATKLGHAPRSSYEYSNFAVGLLAQLLVDLQQQPSFDALCQQRICDPLRLDDTRCTPTEAMSKRLAPAYDEAGRRRQSWTFRSLAGAGAIRSTVHDMLKFAQANLDPQRHTATLAAALRLAQESRYKPPFLAKTAGQPEVACGWHFGANQHVIWHNGATGGYRSHLLLDTKRQWAVIVLANTTSAQIDAVTKQIYRAMLGKQVEPLAIRRSIEVPAATLHSYTGKYQLGPESIFDLRVEDGVLTARLTGQPRFPLFATTQTRFFYRSTPAEIEFTVADGKATELRLFQHSREIPAKRVE